MLTTTGTYQLNAGAEHSIMERLHKIIRLADLPSFCGLKRTQIETLIAAGKFPRPVKLSERRKGWLESDIIGWQQARIALRDANDAVVP